MAPDETEFGLNLPTLLTGISSIVTFLIVFGGILPFLPQYFKIKRSQSVEGFSTHLCLTLLIANTLRVIFWFGVQFEIPLLCQSIFMIFVMLALMHLCVTIKNQTIVKGKERLFTGDGDHSTVEYVEKENRHSFRDFDRRYFWKWTDFQSYVEFLLVFAMLGCLLMYTLIEVPVFVHSIGFVALLSESMLAMPQLIKNHQNRSTEGMSNLMIFLLFAGDLAKTIYFLIKDQPPQFWICGSIQILIDLVIMGQMAIFRGNNPRFKKGDN